MNENQSIDIEADRRDNHTFPKTESLSLSHTL